MKKHLIIVDVQNDFVDGSLAVPGAKDAIEKINLLTASGKFDSIVATQDWHPEGHISFGLWPNHCIQHTLGAKLNPRLEQNHINLIIRKGMNPDMDSYSAFYENDKKTETGLHRFYIPDIENSSEGQQFYFVGLATDYCVKFSALDCKKEFECEEVFVIEDACAGVAEDSTTEAIEEMVKAGIKVIMTKDILNGY